MLKITIWWKVLYFFILKLRPRELRWFHKNDPVGKREGLWMCYFVAHCYFWFPVQFSHSVMSDSRWPHWPQHTRLPCPSPTPRACSNSCPLSQWCHPTISSSVVPFSSCFQPLPSSGSFPVSQLFASGGQSVRAPASAPVLPINIQDCTNCYTTSGPPLSTSTLTERPQAISAESALKVYCTWSMPLRLHPHPLWPLTRLLEKVSPE